MKHKIMIYSKLIYFYFLLFIPPAYSVETQGHDTGGTTYIVRKIAIEVSNLCSGNLPCDINPQLYYGSHADFGGDFPFGRPETPQQYKLSIPPPSNELLCDDTTLYSNINGTNDFYNTIMLIPRGTCSFEVKVLNAEKLGVAAVIIYNTLSSRYSSSALHNKNFPYPMSDIIWPKSEDDYECRNGRSWIPFDLLSFEPLPYNSTINDPLLSGLASEGNLCAANNENDSSFYDTCKSKSCLLTGAPRWSNLNITHIEACCAWDMDSPMASDKYIKSDITIPSTRITHELGSQLRNQYDTVTISIYERYYPKYNISGLILSLLAVSITFFASWLSANTYRFTRKEVYETLLSRDAEFNQSRNVNQSSGNNSPVPQSIHQSHTITNVNNQSTLPTNGSNNNDLINLSTLNDRNVQNTPSPEESTSTLNDRNRQNTSSTEELTTDRIQTAEVNYSTPRHFPIAYSFEINTAHAILFLVMISTALLVMFFFRSYTILKAFFVVAGGAVIANLILIPMLSYCVHKQPRLKFLESQIRYEAYCIFLDSNWLKVISYIMGFAIGIAWFTYGFVIDDAYMKSFYWIIQDVMGICFCIIFLGFLQLSSVKVSTFLLIAGIFYDILFVIIIPLFLTNDSVMFSVTFGNISVSDAEYCEKYPQGRYCFLGTIFPILFYIPRINDYRGGIVAIGYGDIMLPGLLSTFCSKLDVAKDVEKLLKQDQERVRGNEVVVGDMMTPSNKTKRKWYSSYFTWVMIGYTLGMCFTFVAYYYTRKAQPALLYLAPSCLFFVYVVGLLKGELKSLWKGPKALVITRNITLQLERGGRDGILRWINSIYRNPRNPYDTASESDESSVGSLDNYEQDERNVTVV